jgi:hypothetical protein
MPIDGELYRQARRWYQDWNRARSISRARNAGQLTPEQGWKQYLALWEFCMKLAPQPSEKQRQQRLEEYQRYYARIEQFEEWRRAHGKTT